MTKSKGSFRPSSRSHFHFGRAGSPSAPVGQQPSHSENTRRVRPATNPACSANAPCPRAQRHLPLYATAKHEAMSRASSALTREMFAEYETVAVELQPGFPPATCNSRGALAWIRLKAEWFEPALLGKQRSCNRVRPDTWHGRPKHRRGAGHLPDRHWLVLKKPFGIEIVTPAAFFAWLRESHPCPL